jgi:hypothetical protein
VIFMLTQQRRKRPAVLDASIPKPFAIMHLCVP